MLGGGAGVTGFLALKANSDNKDQRSSLNTSASQLHDSDKKAHNLALASDVLTGAAVVCAGVATVIWISTPSSHSTQIGVSVSPGQASLVGRF